MRLFQRLILSLATCLIAFNSYANDPVPASYEFKQLLPASAFKSPKAILDYQQALISLLTSFGEVSGQLALSDHGLINFYDTKGCHLKQNGLILRHRRHHEQWQLTLKLRSNNEQSLYQSPLMMAGEFQADVIAKPKLRTIYSIASSKAINAVPNNLNLLAQLFPALAQRPQFEVLGALELKPLSQQQTQQAVYEGLKLKLGKHKLKFSLTIWSRPPENTPVIAEISFKIGNKKHPLDDEQLQSVYKVLDNISKMPAWQSTIDSTKTQWFYQQATRLCQSLNH